ncbi:DUF58 domain-containing protein [Psychromonas sp. KJ10-10]|uniref:DUF58 domain-containing protein n=1 Tax=Psychromonas sp. KJ10-10 TaxID=3391823 RepID=UPI0039B4366E
MFNNFIRKRFDKWLVKRMPAQRKITLNSGNTFIFPSKTGLHFLISCLILFLLGTNYQNNLILFLVFFLCSFMFTCLLFSYQNIAGLGLKAIQPEAQFASSPCRFTLTLQQPKSQVQDVNFYFKSAQSDLESTIKNETVVLYSYSEHRGYFNPGRVTVKSSFPFGLFNVWTHLDFDLRVLLYPSPIENQLTQSKTADKSQHNTLYQPVVGVEQFSTLKSYQIGESLKSVAWKQLAQGRGWLSKQFEQSAGGDLLLDIRHLGHLSLEMRLSYLTYQIVTLEKIKQRYALTLNQHHIEIGLGTSHKERCLRALALFNVSEKENQDTAFQSESSRHQL